MLLQRLGEPLLDLRPPEILAGPIELEPERWGRIYTIRDVTAQVHANNEVHRQKQFFESLVSRMESLQNQNRDLLDQLAETNRDLMKLQFRVDTHSESFRPLPVSEDRPFTSLDDTIGVLPPRAEPVLAPSQE